MVGWNCSIKISRFSLTMAQDVTFRKHDIRNVWIIRKEEISLNGIKQNGMSEKYHVALERSEFNPR